MSWGRSKRPGHVRHDVSVGMDVGERIAGLYGITGVPETFIVDQEGRIAHVHIGPVRLTYCEWNWTLCWGLPETKRTT